MMMKNNEGFCSDVTEQRHDRLPFPIFMFIAIVARSCRRNSKDTHTHQEQQQEETRRWSRWQQRKQLILLMFCITNQISPRQQHHQLSDNFTLSSIVILLLLLLLPSDRRLRDMSPWKKQQASPLSFPSPLCSIGQQLRCKTSTRLSRDTYTHSSTNAVTKFLLSSRCLGFLSLLWFSISYPSSVDFPSEWSSILYPMSVTNEE